MFGNTFKFEKTNRNLTLQADFLWLFKLSLFSQLSIISLFATAISIFNQPNTLKCDRSIEKCILNISLIFDSADIEIPLSSLKDAKLIDRATSSTIELITDLEHTILLSYARFSNLENGTETLTKIKSFINNESIDTLYIEQDNIKGNYIMLGIAGLIPLTGVAILSLLLKDTTFELSKNTNELTITAKSIWQTKQELHSISQIEKVELKPFSQFDSNPRMYELNLIIKSGKAKKIVIIDSSKISAIEIQKQTEKLIFNN